MTAAGVRPQRRWTRWAIAEAIVLSGLAALVAVLFAAVILALGRPPTRAEWKLLGLCAIAAGVCSLLWIPLRERLTTTAATIAGGGKDQPEPALRALGGRLTRALPLDELLLQVVETLRRAMALDGAEVWTGADGVLERAASDPDRGGRTLILTPAEQGVISRAEPFGPARAAVWVPGLTTGREEAVLRAAPVMSAGQLLGLIVVERAAGARPFGEEDDRLLADLARQLGLTLRNVQLDSTLQATLDELRLQATELRASRARVVSAADAERRRIERDLHDGAQQQLVGLVVNVRLARELADIDPVQAKALLDDVGRDAKEAIEELRELAHGIYPPLLLDRGLVDALRAAARRTGLPARIDAPGVGRHPPEREATIYFCCVEALQNAAKHAGDGAQITIRVWEEEGGLRFEVSDDGAGFDPGGRGAGVGLTNMRDRLGAIGGRLSIASERGRGTSVSGTIPIAP
jgi:signal transduction histidine kinase